ncbi:MAG: FAD:protein FMN transferase [Planctomycetota bacterium]
MAPHRLAAEAMATRFELVLDGADDVAVRAAGEAALLAVEDTDAELSRFRSDSFASRLARSGPEDPVPLDAERFALLVLCDDVREATGGAFDLCHLGPGRLVLDRERRRAHVDAPGTTVDFGAVGKGVALDRAALELRDAGIAVALLHGGTSTVVALGAPPGRTGFGVRVALPGGGGHDVSLTDAALSVSAQHGQDRLPGGGHVVDARRGGRAVSALLPTDVVAVTAPTATLADLWSTALLAHGPTDDLLRRALACGVRPIPLPKSPR